MRVFHGSTVAVEEPDVTRSRANLDFGRGFYVTSISVQAGRWARRKSLRSRRPAVVSEYELDIDPKGFQILRLDADARWLDFVVACRRGGPDYLRYDLISGPVADDRVYEAVDFYFRGLWDQERTLAALRFYEMNDQLCLITQRAVDERLTFISADEVST